MTDRPTQPTQPTGGEPVEIPIPTRREFVENMSKVAPRVEPPASADEPDDQD